MSILDQFDLKGSQLDAAARLDSHLAVTAGAGSGKTRALVARYLHFVEPLASRASARFASHYGALLGPPVNRKGGSR